MVLAKLAGKIAACRTERQHRRAGKEMVQRLLFDWIDTETRRTSPGLEHDRAVFGSAHETQPALPLMQLAFARANIATHASVIEMRPMPRGHAFRKIVVTAHSRIL